MDMLITPPELVRATYNVYRYTDEIYKIVHHKSDRMSAPRGDVSDHVCYDVKLAASLSRARRVVLELALCNPWDWFVTLTISSAFDRSDLDAWYKRFAQWLRDQRKSGLDIAYLIVPERHADGSWHAHGLMRGNMPLVSFADEWCNEGLRVPRKLIDGDYYDWPVYRRKFGFCSFGRIRNPVAAGMYVTKYLTKDVSRMVSEVGAHTYYNSRGLMRATLHQDVYGACAALDKYCVNHYDFCDTGMTHVRDGLDWTFALEYGLVSPLDDLVSPEVSPAALEADLYMDCVQSILDGFDG